MCVLKVRTAYIPGPLEKHPEAARKIDEAFEKLGAERVQQQHGRQEVKWGGYSEGCSTWRSISGCP